MIRTDSQLNLLQGLCPQIFDAAFNLEQTAYINQELHISMHAVQQSSLSSGYMNTTILLGVRMNHLFQI